MTCLAALCIATAAFTVTDGDTLRARDLRLRLFGIDAPERGAPGAEDATEALRYVLHISEYLACDDMGRSFNRTVARCDIQGGVLDGLDLSCVLIQLGAAVEWPKYSGGIYEECG